MKIFPNDYWLVDYRHKTRGYCGVVQVKELVPQDKGYSCILASDLPQKYVNYLSGALFAEKDFREKMTEKDFIEERIAFLEEQLIKYNKKLRDLE